ncbi:MAG: hypothetical protein U5L96_15460 [Owenweeksia sp.]|nr:hypothetical protein [Owenweeksia sp.]
MSPYLVSDSARWFNMAFSGEGQCSRYNGVPVQATGNTSNTNIFTYDATADADVNGEGDFIPVPNTAFEIRPGGISMYAGDGTFFGTAPFTVRSKGTPAQ